MYIKLILGRGIKLNIVKCHANHKIYELQNLTEWGYD